MKSYKIHSKDLIQIFESGLLSYQVSERTLKDQTARIRHLLDFMLQKKLEVYDESVGELFCILNIIYIKYLHIPLRKMREQSCSLILFLAGLHILLPSVNYPINFLVS